jgi:ribosomal protein S27E
MIQFNCNGCGNPFSVPESMGGTQASCDQCGTIVTIPTPGLGPVPAETDRMPAAPVKPMTPPTRIVDPLQPHDGGIPKIVWVLVAGGGAIAVVVIALAILLNSVVSAFKTDSVADAGSQTPSANESRTASSTRTKRSSIDANTYVSPPRDTSSSRPSFRPEPSSNYSSSESPFETDGSPVNNSRESASALPPKSDARPTKTEAPTKAKTTPERTTGNAVTSAKPSSWASDTLRIPFDRDADVTLGPIGCPVIIVKNDVWHVAKKQIVQELEGVYESRVLKALSANGQWFAAASKTPNQQDTSITVWNVVTGKVSCEIPGDPERFADLITFTRNQYLLIGGRLKNDIRVFDAETGRRLNSIELNDRIDEKKVVFTADGQYFTTVDNGRLQVVATKTGRTAAVMQSPAPVFETGETPNQVQRKIATERVVRDVEVIKFAPDSEEIAAVSTRREPRLLVWDNRGKLVLDKPFPSASHKFFFDPALDWFPDRSAWIVSGHVFDRKSERVVLVVHQSFGDDLLIRAIDRDHLLANFPHNKNVLELVRIPWDRINASLKLLEEGAPALLSPNEPVSIDIELSGLRGNQSQTVAMITEALGKRLEQVDIRVARDCPTFFKLRFSEQAGDSVPIYERQSPFDFRGSDTGRTVREAEGSLVVELVAKGETIWRDTIEATSSSSFREEINDASVRNSMVENLTRRINNLRFPYFVPESKDHLALPIVIQ